VKARAPEHQHVLTRDSCCAADGTCDDGPPAPVARDAVWLRAARQARWLAWISLAWMCTEGAIGLWQGIDAGSVALTGWALGSAVEGLASVIVVWRFTGSRILSGTAERRAQRGVAVSFWLLAPYVAAESVRDLAPPRPPPCWQASRSPRPGQAPGGWIRPSPWASPR
jgi:hypothetical protein